LNNDSSGGISVKAFMLLYRRRALAYALLLSLMIAVGMYRASFGWEVVGPSIMLYLPTSLIGCVLSRLFGFSSHSGGRRMIDLPRRCWRFLIIPGLALLTTHEFLVASYLPIVGMWALLCSLELYLIDAETIALETQRTAHMAERLHYHADDHAQEYKHETSVRVERDEARSFLSTYRRRLGFYAGLMLVASAGYFTPTTFLINVFTYPVCLFLPLSIMFSNVRFRHAFVRRAIRAQVVQGIRIDALLWAGIGAGAIVVCSYLYLKSLPVSILGMMVFLLAQEGLVIHDEEVADMAV
jgi:hypothetical protein